MKKNSPPRTLALREGRGKNRAQMLCRNYEQKKDRMLSVSHVHVVGRDLLAY